MADDGREETEIRIELEKMAAAVGATVSLPTEGDESHVAKSLEVRLGSALPVPVIFTSSVPAKEWGSRKLERAIATADGDLDGSLVATAIGGDGHDLTTILAYACPKASPEALLRLAEDVVELPTETAAEDRWIESHLVRFAAGERRSVHWIDDGIIYHVSGPDDTVMDIAETLLRS